MEWDFYDTKEMTEEFRTLDTNDRVALMRLMELYAKVGEAAPVLVERYGDGLLCLRHRSGAFKGRCLFFHVTEKKAVALLVYRKQSARADPRAVETARNRMKDFKTR